VFREVPLQKVGVIMMVLAFVIAAVVVSVGLRSEPERVVLAEVATKSPGEAPRYSSGQERIATKKSSSQKDSPRNPSGEEESLGFGSSSSGGPMGQREEDAKEPQAMLQQEAEGWNSQSATPQLAGQQTPSEAPSGPQLQPQQHQPHQQEQPLPDAEQRGWSEPSQGDLKSANAERHYELLPGAIMGLTIEAIGIYDAPSSTPTAAGH
jgi:hypothetical protein